MKYGRFVGGSLVEIFVPPEGRSIEECFHPGVVFEELPSDAEIGWVKDETGAVVNPVPQPLPDLSDEPVNAPPEGPPPVIEEPAPSDPVVQPPHLANPVPPAV